MVPTLGRRAPTIAAVFVLSVGLRLALLHRIPIPQPAIHDEFAYLLGADTFAHGRLANPPHALADFFETPQVLTRPTYAMKYQPGQALFLALGQKVFGHPYFGIVLSVSLMTAAFCWMLQAWVPPVWALLGGLLALRTFHAGHYWMQSYWGGAVTALGAALVLGGYGRMARGQERAAWIAGVGAILMLLCRPYESLGLLAAIGAALVWHRRCLPIPLLVCGVAFAVFQGYYNWRVTGNWYTVPQLLHARQYQAAPILWVLPPLPPKPYHYPELARLYATEEMRSYLAIHARPLLPRLGYLLSRTLSRLPSTFHGVWLAWLLAWTLPDRRLRELALLCLPPLAFLLLGTWLFPHYEAAFVPLALLLLTRAAWRVWNFRAGKPFVALFFLVSVLPTHTATAAAPTASSDVAKDRPALIRKLLAAGGRHVVIVRYAPDHNVHQEWVYNAADIDASPIVWARDRGADDARLLAYYSGRTFWLLEPDSAPLRLTPYPATR